jgi:hypothetical protein
VQNRQKQAAHKNKRLDILLFKKLRKASFSNGEIELSFVPKVSFVIDGDFSKLANESSRIVQGAIGIVLIWVDYIFEVAKDIGIALKYFFLIKLCSIVLADEFLISTRINEFRERIAVIIPFFAYFDFVVNVGY